MTGVVAKFQLSNAFNLTGRGWVLVGEIIDGHVNKDYIIRLSVNGTYIEYKIRSVEFVDSFKSGKAELGLIIEATENIQNADVNVIAVTRQLCLVFRNSP